MYDNALALWKLYPLPLGPLPLAPLPVTIGRHVSSRLVLPEDDVSRHHAAIELRDEELVVVDQGSRNGVYQRGRRVGVAPTASGAVLRVGQSVLWLAPEMPFRVRLEEFASTAASTRTPLLLSGERGSGKRTLAREIHARSGRSGLFLSLTQKVDPAILAACANGTLVCEVGDDFDDLAALAERHGVRLVGVADSARPGVESFEVAPLRARLDELPLALGKLLAGRQWNADFIEALACHPFLLNFAELELVCRGLPAQDGPLGIEHLPQSVRAHVVEARAAASDDLSRDRLHDALSRHKGNVRRVGQELGVQRGQLYRVLASFGLNPDAYRGATSPSGPLSPAPSSRTGDERRTSP